MRTKLKVGMTVDFVFAAKRRNICRGSATIIHIDEKTKQITFDAVPPNTKPGDVITPEGELTWDIK